MKDKNVDRRRFLLGTAAATFGTSFGLRAGSETSASPLPVNPVLPSLKGRKILYTWGGWSGHEPEQSVGLFKPWLESEGATVEVFNSLDPYTDTAYMNGIDLVIQIFTMAQITDEQEKGLLQAVKNGMGIAGWHGGLCDAFRQNDPVTRGLNGFNMHSEQYYMHVDPNVKVLASTTFSGEHADWIEGCIVPVIWKKMYGKGRVFYTSLGHVMKDFQVPEALEILKRGIRWASASKYDPPEPWKDPVY
jgi:type 1 glutamine amidotransferase